MHNKQANSEILHEEIIVDDERIEELNFEKRKTHNNCIHYKMFEKIFVSQ